MRITVSSAAADNYLPSEGIDARIPTALFGPLAQLAEQGTLNAKVRGSSPWRVMIDTTVDWAEFIVPPNPPFSVARILQELY